MSNKKRKSSGVDRFFDVIVHSLLVISLVACLYPMIYIVSASISSPEAVISGKVFLWPIKPTLDGYKAIFQYKLIWSGYANSLFYMAIGTSVNVLLTLLAAYPLSRKDFFGKDIFMFILVFTMFFSGGLIPTFLIVKNIGILYTRWAMILPSAMGIWNVIITRTFFQHSIPDELLEASQLDGCTDFKFLYKVVIPLSGSIIAVISLFYAVGHWNSYFPALIYLNEQKMFPLQIILRDILIANEMSMEMLDIFEEDRKQNLRDLIKFAIIVVATAPTLMLYPFVQKYFVKGIMIGSLKG